MVLFIGATPFYGAYFGQGYNLRIHINNAQCAGNESRLIDCSYDTDTRGCTHSEDAGIHCLQRNSYYVILQVRMCSITSKTFSQLVTMEKFNLWMDFTHLKGGWKFALMDSGGPFVTLVGQQLNLRLSVTSLEFLHSVR